MALLMPSRRSAAGGRTVRVSHSISREFTTRRACPPRSRSWVSRVSSSAKRRLWSSPAIPRSCLRQKDYARLMNSGVGAISLPSRSNIAPWPR